MDHRHLPQSALPVAGALTLAHDIRIDLTRSGDHFLGLGEIAVGGQVIRSGRRPMFAHVRNPMGVELIDHRLDSVSTAGDGSITLQTSAHRRQTELMEWMLHTVRNRVSTADWSAPPAPATGTTLSLELRPAELELGSWHGRGFSYQYHYRTPSDPATGIPIYRLLDRATWEPGGAALGNEIWLRQAFAPSVFALDDDSRHYSTEWYLPSAANPNVFQFNPLQTQFQGFVMTVGAHGALVVWATDAAHIRTLIERPRHSGEIVHLHEHCADLAHAFDTTPMEVLWFPGATSRVDRANLYEAVRAHVSARLHARIGMREDRVTTYGVIEEWGNADLVRYREKGLEKLADAGVKTVMLANHFQNDMNTFGVSNMCCTVDWKVAEDVGEENLAAFGRSAGEAGVAVEMWGNTALSTFALKQWDRNGRKARVDWLPREGTIREVLDRAADPFVRNAAYHLEADHYSPVFACLNLRDPVVRAHWLDRWRWAHQELGITGIFLDSSVNLSGDKFHWIANTASSMGGATTDASHLFGTPRPAVEPPSAILSQYKAHLSLMAEMQKIGFTYCGEDMGVFGVNRTAPAMSMALGSLFLWGNVLAGFDAAELLSHGHDPADVFFRGMAYRLMWKLYWLPEADKLSWRYLKIKDPALDIPSRWQLNLLKVFNQVREIMIERQILPGEQGVVYRGHDGRRVLWAFTDLALDFDEDVCVRDVLSGEAVTSRRLEASARRVYVMEEAPAPATRSPAAVAV